MSENMSMFKKMKERITDEVNSATNKVQSMQIINSLTTNLSQQIVSNMGGTSDSLLPDQPLPELEPSGLTQASINDLEFNSQPTSSRDNHDVSLIDIDDELNDDLEAELSPQNQLFNEKSIRRIRQTKKNKISASKMKPTESKIVINLDDISSDLDEDLEIDLLTESCDQFEDSTHSKDHMQIITPNISNYKSKYKSLVHAVREFRDERFTEKARLEGEVTNLSCQLDSLKRDLNHPRQSSTYNNDTATLSASSSQSEFIDKTADGRASPQSSVGSTGNKQLRKIRDLEKLLAKCKESLKAKNSQLAILKESLMKVDQFREVMDEAKGDLSELKKAYEIWTVSVAENKRVMHQEIEDKVSEMEKYKSEIKELELQIRDQNIKMNQLKSNIQTLESRLVSTSAAHQKERDSLLREMNAAKTNALKQQQKEHQLQLERVKLDLEKSIEALKSELIFKDEQIIISTKSQQELSAKNQELIRDFNESQATLAETLERFDQIKSTNEIQAQEISQLKQEVERSQKIEGQTDSSSKTEFEDLQKSFDEYQTKYVELEKDHSKYKNKCRELELQNSNLQTTIEEMTKDQSDVDKLRSNLERLEGINSILNKDNQSLKAKVSDFSRHVELIELDKANLEAELANVKSSLEEQSKEIEPCQGCLDSESKIAKVTENYEQLIHELNTRIDLMTNANNDQEKAISVLETKYEGALGSVQSLKADLEEIVKKNDSLMRVLQDNEVEMQQQQEQVDKLTAIKQEVDNLRKDNSVLSSSLAQVKQDLQERINDLNQSREQNGELKRKLLESEEQLKTRTKTLENERDSLNLELARENQRRESVNQQLVVSILSAIKNLASPDASPGSDKTLTKQSDEQKEDTGDWSQDENGDFQAEQSLKSLPDPLRLAKELSSLAMQRSNDYMTADQRLKAAILDNSMMNDELRRLRDELNALNQEKNQEVQFSLDEVERLKTENQALIHDQKAYDDHVGALENEIRALNEQLNELKKSRERLKVDLEQHSKRDTKEVSVEVRDFQSQDDLEARYNELDDLLRCKEEEIAGLRDAVAEKSSTIDKYRDELESQRDCSQAQRRDSNQHPKEQPTGSDHYVPPDHTEFEYLKNIVYQFMVGREPLTLARVISAVFKFDKNQAEQIYRVQEAIHQISS